MKSRLQTFSKRCRLHVHQPFTHSLFGRRQKACRKWAENPKLFDFLKPFLLTNQAGHLPENHGASETPSLYQHFSCLIWLWIIMTPRRKLSILDHGRVAAQQNEGVRNRRLTTEIISPLSNSPMDFVVFFSAVFTWPLTCCEFTGEKKLSDVGTKHPHASPFPPSKKNRDTS